MCGAYIIGLLTKEGFIAKPSAPNSVREAAEMGITAAMVTAGQGLEILCIYCFQ